MEDVPKSDLLKILVPPEEDESAPARKRKPGKEKSTETKKHKVTFAPTSKRGNQQKSKVRKLSKAEDKPQAPAVTKPAANGELAKTAATQEHSPSPTPSPAAIASANAKVSALLSGDTKPSFNQPTNPVTATAAAPPRLFNQNKPTAYEKEAIEEMEEAFHQLSKELPSKPAVSLDAGAVPVAVVAKEATTEILPHTEGPTALPQAFSLPLDTTEEANGSGKATSSGNSTPRALKKAPPPTFANQVVVNSIEKNTTTGTETAAPSAQVPTKPGYLPMQHYRYKKWEGIAGRNGPGQSGQAPLTVSKAVSLGGVLYISDIMRPGKVPEGKEIDTPASFYLKQVKDVLEELAAVLEEAGAGKGDLVSVTVKLKDSEVGYKPFVDVWNAWLGNNGAPVS